MENINEEYTWDITLYAVGVTIAYFYCTTNMVFELQWNAMDSEEKQALVLFYGFYFIYNRFIDMDDNVD
jgi:hypothetical protein